MKKHIFGFAGVTAVVMLQSVAVFGAATTTPGAATGDPTVSGPQISALPPMFDASVAQGMGSQMLNCFNVGAALNGVVSAIQNPNTLGGNTGDQLTNVVNNMSGNLGGNKFMSGGGCGPDTVDTSTFSCPMNATPDSIDKLLKSRQDRLDKAMAAITCEKGKFEAVQTQLSCLQNQAQVLQAQVGTLQKAFQDNIQRMQSDVQLIKSVEADRGAQLDDVNNRLNGTAGVPGLLAMKDQVQQAVNAAMPAEILAVKKNFEDLTNGQKALAETTQNRMMQFTTNCFNTNTAGGFRCVPNGPPVSIRDYVLCRYQQNQQLGTGGVIETNQIVANQAASSSSALDALLNQIMGASAKLQAPSQDPQAGFNAVMNSTVTANTPEDIEAQYGSQLAAYNGKGLNIHDFVMTQMRSCYSTAQQVIAREKNMASSPIGAQQAALDAQTRANQTQVNTFFDKYGQLYTQAMASLTGQHLPLNTSACVGANPTVQQNCLDDMQRNMSALLNGNSPNSTMNIQIRGTNAANAISVTCQGLAGCVTAMSATRDNLDRETKRLKQFKSDYILKANQNVEAFTKQMATMLSPQSQMIQQKFQQMGQVLAGLGVSFQLPKGIQSEQLTKDGDGLPETPKNVLGLVGSQMNPPMPDMGGDGFSQGLQAIADGRNKLNDKEGNITQAKSDLIAQAQTCQMQMASGAGDKFANLADKFNQCSKTYQFCKQMTSSTPWSDLQNLLPRLNLPVDGSFDSGAALQIGADCSDDRLKDWEAQQAIIDDNTRKMTDATSKKSDADTSGFNRLIETARKRQGEIFSGENKSCPNSADAIASNMIKVSRPLVGSSDSGDGSSSGAR